MTEPPQPPGVDELLDRALRALGEGNRVIANQLAEQVLAVDRHNLDAEDLLAAPADSGEIRRITILFADLVDSTELSTRVEPETYRTVVGRYRDEVQRVVERYGGHIGTTKGDGLLVFFGHPEAHEDDVRRAVQAGLDITHEVTALSARVKRRFGFEIDVRVGVHRGIAYLDTKQDDVYGFAANLAARVCSLADPGTVAVSQAVEGLIRGRFELRAQLPKAVKGVDQPIRYFLVVAERDLTPIGSGPLVGRDDELEYLRRAWEQATLGQLTTPGAVFVGEAGIGKSRLAWSAVEMAERSHGVVLQLVGSPFHTDVGLRPIRRLLERRCGITRTSQPEERLRHLRSELEQRSLDADVAVPLLAPVLGIGAEAGYTAVAAEGLKLYEQITGAVFDYLIACSRDAPTLILVEDMHWFDEDTFDVVESLLGGELSGHVLVVMTNRHNTPLPKTARAQVFELKPLSDEEADQLIVALHPRVRADEQKAIRQRCVGLPLYIEEVVAKLKAQPSDEASSLGVPDTLYEALFARLRSSPGALRVVEAAAVIGSRIECGLLRSILDVADIDVDAVVTELVEGRVLESIDHGRYRFRHDLLREVAEELSPPTQRRRLHSRIADSLVATQGTPDWPMIARHYERAERYTEAASAYGAAAANARQRGALREALAHLTYAIAQAERCADGPERDRVEVSLRLARAFLAQAAEGVASKKVAADFERCLALCGSNLADDDLFSTVMSLYPYYTMRADLDRAERLVMSVRAQLTGQRASFMPINEFGLGQLAWYRGEFGYAKTKLNLAATTLTEACSRDLETMLFMPNDATAGLYAHLAMARFIDGDLAGVAVELERAERRCAEIPFPKGAFSLAYARQLEVLVRAEAGQLQRAAEVAADLRTLGEQHGFDSWALVGVAQLGTVAALSALADNADAAALRPHVEALTAFVGACRAMSAISLVTFYDAVLARLLVASGDLTDARQRLDTGLELAEQTRMHFYDAELMRLRAQTADDEDQRRDDLESARDLARRQDAPIFELRCAADLFQLDEARFRDAVTAALSRFPDNSSWPEVAAAQAMIG
ncbi:ATP-binding protein [Mycobacterium paraterrae]|uniref:AAA family ATPase n=1 Tax=Mycobacterium paraterrae TaxID=577492 RepID=A0ABY3VES2_9MYCO|nr:adenylate/guanylate cyclase domain-containing protein [Mycobacterium paraterrae]UMB67881.1 AAA family ATPase [Mycobacterium paraterrae]